MKRTAGFQFFILFHLLSFTKSQINDYCSSQSSKWNNQIPALATNSKVRYNHTGTIDEKHRQENKGIMYYLLQNYSKSVTPNPPVHVNVSLRIHDISRIDDVTNSFELDYSIVSTWLDQRLNFYSYAPCRHNLSMAGHLEPDIWKPNVCIVNSKRTTVHASPGRNIMMVIFQDGTLVLYYRVRTLAPCNMDLTKFPLDTQSCMLTLEAYPYNTADVNLFWGEEGVNVENADQLHLADFILVHQNFSKTVANYTAGEWHQLNVKFTFRRLFGFYVLQVYLPTYISMLDCCISWLAFWVDTRALPARITLGTNSLMALIFQFGNVARSLPRVSYVKALDVWMFSCVGFIFLSLLELAIVAFNDTLTDRKARAQRNKRRHVLEAAQEDNNPASEQLARISTAQNGDMSRQEEMESKRTRLLTGVASQMVKSTTAKRIDQVSAVLFPFSFGLFNLWYWHRYRRSEDEMFQ